MNQQQYVLIFDWLSFLPLKRPPVLIDKIFLQSDTHKVHDCVKERELVGGWGPQY